MGKEYNPGDFVEVHLSKVIYEGILLETPKSEKGIILLKLGTGYNIGLNKKDIVEVKLLKKGEKAKKEFELKKDKEKPNIAMIITGGTIASKLDPKTGGVHPLESPEELFSIYPEMFEHVNITKVEIPFMKASEDMNYKDWQKIAKVTEKLLNDSNIKGVIITHGTDFLHYTSAALSFFLKNLNKPVVLTYSQRSIDRASSDANLNLQCSAVCAISNIAEVILVGHGSSDDNYCNAIIGTKVKKMHSSKRDAFKAINDSPIARVTAESIEPQKEYNLRDNSKKVKVDTTFEGKVALVKIYPGQDPGILDYYLKNKYKGIVLEVSGLAHVPTRGSRNNWIKKLKEVQDKGLIICATVQTVYGRADPYVYSNGREVLETGVIYLEDMLSETALVKLGYVLGKTNNREEVKKLMLENMAKEFNPRLN
jgi:glutamyl-tRNA(Gln) amidotransferase subunit D